MHKHIAALAALALAGAAQAALPVTDKPVERASFTGRWPFTVDKGVIGCERGKAVKFVVDRKTYAVNGTATAYSKEAGFGWRDAREIWLDDPKNPGGKIPISDMITAGLALCRSWP